TAPACAGTGWAGDGRAEHGSGRLGDGAREAVLPGGLAPAAAGLQLGAVAFNTNRIDPYHARKQGGHDEGLPVGRRAAGRPAMARGARSVVPGGRGAWRRAIRPSVAFP